MVGDGGGGAIGEFVSDSSTNRYGWAISKFVSDSSTDRYRKLYFLVYIELESSTKKI